MNIDQVGFFFDSENQPNTDYLQLHHIITDRGSKYSVTAAKVKNETELKLFLKKLKSNKKYQKATHNSYAARFAIDKKVTETKSDDSETGAGMAILRSIRNANMVNVAVVVTRWYGGVKLFNDRFKHIQDGSREILKQIASD